MWLDECVRRVKLWGLAVGAAVTVAMIGSLAQRRISRGNLRFMLGYGFALVLLTRPPLWLAVGSVRC